MSDVVIFDSPSILGNHSSSMKCALALIALIIATSASAEDLAANIAPVKSFAPSAPSSFERGSSERELNSPEQIVVGSPEEQSYILNEKGVELSLRGEMLAGRKLIEQALEKNPKNVTAMYNIAGIYLTNGESDKAISAMQNALAIEPKEISFLNRLAEAQFVGKKLNDATTTYQKIISIDRTHELALARLGVIYSVLGKLELAEKTLRDAVEMNPRDQHSLQSLGSVLVIRKKYGDAVLVLESALALEKDPDTAANLGLAYLGKQERAAALKNFKLAKSLGSKDPTLDAEIEKLESHVNAVHDKALTAPVTE